MERSECEELCLRRESPLACRVICLVSSSLVCSCVLKRSSGSSVALGFSFPRFPAKDPSPLKTNFDIQSQIMVLKTNSSVVLKLFGC